MDLRQTRTFVTVAELGTISRAAQHLRIAQPALSRQLQNLERELGLKLFDRVGGRLLLTSQGEQLLGDCRDLIAQATGVRERAQSLRQEDSGVLKVAAAPGHIESVFADFLHVYAKRYPNVQVRLIDAFGPKMLAMLERGEINLGQILAHAIQLDDRRFAGHPLESMDILAAYHPNLALGKARAIEIARLAPHPLLLLDTDFVLRRNFDALCQLAGLKPNVVLESRDPRTLLAMAEAGHGVAIVPSVLRLRHYALRIVAVNYRGKPLQEPLTILWDKRRPRPRYAADFCAMLANYVSEIFPIMRPTGFKSNAGTNQPKGRGKR